jgi:D-alanine-D-alanine ligase-like ATP-grasp enzyme
MINITLETTKFPSLTPEMIAKEVLSRGWSMAQLYEGSSCYKLTRPDGKELTIFSATPPTTSFAAHHIAQDKFACYSYFEQGNFPQPVSIISNSIDDSINQAVPLLSTMKLVVKPLDKAHGMGVSTGINTEPMLRTALERAFKLSSKVIIQEYIENSEDTRILVIDGEVRAALHRKPATIVGDGKSTIDELIKAENNSGNRGVGYSMALSKIKPAAVRAFLGDKINTIPAEGERVQVVGVANMGVGGETVDITDNLPQWLKDMAVDISEFIGLKVAGVDILMAKIPEPASTIEEIKPYLIEINKCPALFMHEKPTHGKSRAVIKDYVNYLEKI